MVTLPEVPDGLEQLIDAYGNPDSDGDHILDSDFFDCQIRIFHFPYPIRLSWKPHILISRFQAHRYVGDVIADAFKEIGDYKGHQYLVENHLDYWGGCFNFRLKRGGTELSVHSWGVAVDINPHIAPMGKKGKQPLFIVNAFVDRGFIWGGAFLDSMHFQAVRNY